MLILVVGLMTSCNVHRFIQCNQDFRKKVEAYTLKLTGARVYTLEPMQPIQAAEASPTELERN